MELPKVSVGLVLGVYVAVCAATPLAPVPPLPTVMPTVNVDAVQFTALAFLPLPVYAVVAVTHFGDPRSSVPNFRLHVVADTVSVSFPVAPALLLTTTVTWPLPVIDWSVVLPDQVEHIEATAIA